MKKYFYEIFSHFLFLNKIVTLKRWGASTVTIECVINEETLLEAPEVLEWSEWSTCSATCDGSQYRFKGDRYHENRETSEQKDCGGPCPYTTSWSEWSKCTVTCGGGVQNRNRDCHLNSKINDGCRVELEDSQVWLTNDFDNMI